MILKFYLPTRINSPPCLHPLKFVPMFLLHFIKNKLKKIIFLEKIGIKKNLKYEKHKVTYHFVTNPAIIAFATYCIQNNAYAARQIRRGNGCRTFIHLHNLIITTFSMYCIKKKSNRSLYIYTHAVTMKKIIISLYFYLSFLLQGIFFHRTKIVQKIYTT